MTDIETTETPEVKQTMAGKTSLVTGSTDGIGLATAEVLLARGSKVMFTGIFTNDAKEPSVYEQDKARFMAEYAKLQAQYGSDKMDFLEIDLTVPAKAEQKLPVGAPSDGRFVTIPAEPSAVDQVVAAAAKLGNGHIDALIHSAGVQRRLPLFSSDPKRKQVGMEDMDWVYNINARAGIATVLAARDYMKHEDGKGRSQVVFLSSVHGLVGCPESAPYCASKFAIEGFIAATKHEFAAQGIRENAVNPAFIRTERLAIKPLLDRTKALLEAQGIVEGTENYEQIFKETFENIEQIRLHLQINPETGKGEWYPMEKITRGVADLVDFSDGIAAGENVRLDFGYVDRAHNEAGAAIFKFPGDPDLKGAKEAFDARNARLAAGQTSGRSVGK